MYNERDSQTFKNKITLNGWHAVKINQSNIFNKMFGK